MYSCTILNQFAQQSQALGVRIPPHLELMHLKTQGGEISLRAARITAASPGFDDAQVSELLQSVIDYREHLLLAVLLMFRPLNETIREALLKRLMTPSGVSPQIICIAELRGILSSPEQLYTMLYSQSTSNVDENLRLQCYQALGALDACLGKRYDQQIDSLGREQYALGARTFLGWCPRLRAALGRLG